MKDCFGKEFEVGGIYCYQTNFATNLAVFASTNSIKDMGSFKDGVWCVVFPFSFWSTYPPNAYVGIKSHVLKHKLIKVDHNLLSDEQLEIANKQRASRLMLPPLVKGK